MHHIDLHVLPLTREASLARLKEFLPMAGSTYAKERNCDLGSLKDNTVSGLSAAIRRRMLTEKEVVDSVVAHHGFEKAEKFIQEVCWRSYWKGWLEQRPEVWTQYLAGIQLHHAAFRESPEKQELLESARSGQTGIECFDSWAVELRETGTLHNHTRMWVASIWVHTLGLPWELGADWFLNHLLDGDPASNTLSWRWVAGLHTKGKVYKAKAANIRSCTNGRFSPGKEVESRFPEPEFVEPPPFRPFRDPSFELFPAPVLILCAEDWALDRPPMLRDHLDHIYLLRPDLDERSSPLLRKAEEHCLQDAASVWSEVAPVSICSIGEFACRWKQELSSVPAKMPWVPEGPWKDRLTSLWQVGQPQWVLREWDRTTWPRAKNGFFGFWKHVRKSLVT